MVSRSLAATVALAAALPLTACAPTRSVSLRVTDGAGRPVHGATIVAISLNDSDIPLPLTFERIGEMLEAKSIKASAVTDAQGEASLTLFEYPTALRVSPPAFDPLADPGEAWLYTLDEKADRLDPPRDRANPAGLEVALVR